MATHNSTKKIKQTPSGSLDIEGVHPVFLLLDVQQDAGMTCLYGVIKPSDFFSPIRS